MLPLIASYSFRSASEHVFTDSIIIVREDEPTSIIAFTLASKTYRDRLRSVGHNRRETRRTDGTAESSTATLLDDTASVLSTGNAYEDPQDTDDTWKREAGTHINYGRSVPATSLIAIFFVTPRSPETQTSRVATLPSRAESFTRSDSPLSARVAVAKIDSSTRWRGASSLTAQAVNLDLPF